MIVARSILLEHRFITHISSRFSTVTMSKPTVALYQRDEALRTHNTKVFAVELASTLSDSDRLLFKQATGEDYVVTTDETVFYAQGGGQPCDTGVMTSTAADNNTSFNVSLVRNGADGRILHLGQFVPADASSKFKSGDKVHQAINGAKRDLNSRIHTGGHIVGLAVRHLQESIPNITELKAQHYPDLAFVDFQGTIESKHKEFIEAQANKFVSQDLPVNVHFWKEAELRERCAVVPVAVAIPEGELVRAVDIVGAGAYPCGGTHVPSTSKVGKITVKKISRSKGNSKVSYSIES